jgi:hypothetical protein
VGEDDRLVHEDSVAPVHRAGLHNPVQVLRPECSSCFCLDPGRAAASRARVLERAADEGELVIPTHFVGSGVVEVRRSGTGGFAVGRWG